MLQYANKKYAHGKAELCGAPQSQFKLDLSKSIMQAPALLKREIKSYRFYIPVTPTKAIADG